MSTEISSTIVQIETPCSKAAASKVAVPESKNVRRFNEARLHAVSSRNMYSLQGLLALIRPASGQVCQSLIVESYCTPGSAQRQAAYPMASQSFVASSVLATPPSVRRVRSQVESLATASKKALGMRTELLEFWPETVA